jgi:hypothetical protein
VLPAAHLAQQSLKSLGTSWSAGRKSHTVTLASDVAPPQAPTTIRDDANKQDDVWGQRKREQAVEREL